MTPRSRLSRAVVGVTIAGFALSLLPGGTAAMADEDRTPLPLTITLRAADTDALDDASGATLDDADRLQALDAAQPTGTSHDRAVAWLRSRGFTVTASDEWTVKAVAPTSTATAAFGVSVERTDDGVRPLGAVRVPAELASSVLAVTGFDTVTQVQPMAHIDRSNFLDGGDFRSAYKAPSSGTGAGTTVATLQFSGWKRHDLCLFVNDAEAPAINKTWRKPRFTDHLTQCHPNATGPLVEERRVGTANPRTNAEMALEVSLDQQALLSVAPLADQRIYFANRDYTGAVDGWNAIAADVEAELAAGTRTVTAVSVSWGNCETTMDIGVRGSIAQAIDRIVAAGVPVFAASGDGGTFNCPSTAGSTLMFPASYPKVVAVGGTNLTEKGYNTDVWVEKAWGPALFTRDRNVVAGGGGVSRVYSRPAFQTAIGVTDARRVVPDIASSADWTRGFLIYATQWCGSAWGSCKGRWMSAGGTSAGAPTQAGLFAAALSTYTPAYRPTVGSLHDILYGAYGTGFRDIAEGTNGLYLSTRGFDKATGLGAPQWDKLVLALNKPALVAPTSVRGLTVPIRVVDNRAGTVTNYLVQENLTSCPALATARSRKGFAASTAPTSVTLAETGVADRVATVGACIYLDGAPTLVTKKVRVDRTKPWIKNATLPRIDTPSAGVGIVRYAAVDGPEGSGVRHYKVRVIRDDGVVVFNMLRELPNVTLNLMPGRRYKVVANAVDLAGNVGPQKTSPTVALIKRR